MDIASPARFSSSDRALAFRLEAAESANVTALARVLAATVPEAAFEPFAGGSAIFAGVESAMTHAVGIGLRGTVSNAELEAMESFFRDRGSACLIDLCPLADLSVVAFVQSRPYRVIEFNNVLARRIGAEERFETPPGIARVEEAGADEWARVIGEGFSEQMPVTDESIAVLMGTASASQCWAAGEGRPAGGAAMGVQDGVALFYGDAVRTGERRKGWQSALIQARLAAAQAQGCDLAAVSVLPGSGSHRNYERAGFQLVYMRVNVRRDWAPAP